MRQIVDLAKSYRLLNHGPTILVTSAHNGVSNVMAAAWAMPLDFSPAKMLVIIDKSTTTRGLIEASGEFALNIPSRAQAKATMEVGSVSGAGIDKFAAAGLKTFAASKIGAPLVEDCLGWVECKVIPEPHNESAYDMFIGEVVAAHADARVFQDGHWQHDADHPLLRSIHYVAGGVFFETGDIFEVKDEAG